MKVACTSQYFQRIEGIDSHLGHRLKCPENRHQLIQLPKRKSSVAPGATLNPRQGDGNAGKMKPVWPRRKHRQPNRNGRSRRETIILQMVSALPKIFSPFICVCVCVFYISLHSLIPLPLLQLQSAYSINLASRNSKLPNEDPLVHSLTFDQYLEARGGKKTSNHRVGGFEG